MADPTDMPGDVEAFAGIDPRFLEVLGFDASTFLLDNVEDKVPFSSSSSGGPSSFASSPYPTAAEGLSMAITRLKQPIQVDNSSSEELSQPPISSRKGHKKSRGGCFPCKRRKIKCQETLPACINCLRRNLECKYPVAKTVEMYDRTAIVRSSTLHGTPSLQSTPTLFTMDDMRFLQHFINVAYPHLPVSNDQVWKCKVPAFAHHYEYLMHAMLGLAATHLTIVTDANYHEVAIKHRLLAMKGFNEALSKKLVGEADGDALLAACYVLTFQSSFLYDGLAEFLTMVRGCVIVTKQLQHQSYVYFFTVKPDTHQRFMEPKLQNLPVIQADFIDSAAASLNMLSFLSDDPTNGVFYGALLNVINAMRKSTRLAYYSLVAIYPTLGNQSAADFTRFLDAANVFGPILLGHFLALEMVLSPILSREWRGQFVEHQFEVRKHWFKSIIDGLDGKLHNYLTWPASILAMGSEELGQKTLLEMPLAMEE